MRDDLPGLVGNGEGLIFESEALTRERGDIVDTTVDTPQRFWLFVAALQERKAEKKKQKSTDFERINVGIGAFGGVREI